MSELSAYLGIGVAILGVCLVGSAFMICDKISDLAREMFDLRMDLKQDECKTNKNKKST